MRNRKFNDENTQSYWQSVTDALTGLLLILLLILMMFMVRILCYNSDNVANYEYEGAGHYAYDDDEDNNDHAHDYDYVVHESGGGGGGNIEPEEVEEDDEEPEIDETAYAAVLVRLADIDTRNTIEEEGVRFELYNSENQLLELSTYYPDEVSYRYFDTREDGTFFIAEKLPQGSYTLKAISKARGYELAEPVYFVVDEDHDWPDPLRLTALASPEKNVIRFQLVDSNGKQVHLAGKFNIYANTDIITDDGTMRFARNELVDTVVCNAYGYGVSVELYLGEYRIETSFEEDFYVGNDKNIITLYSKYSDQATIINEILCEKTTIMLRLTDELYDSIGIGDIQYELLNTATGATTVSTTDSTGRLEFTNLSKDTTYEIRQTNTAGKYQITTEMESVYVDKFGRINEEAVCNLSQTNRMLRINLQVVDQYLGTALSDLNIKVYTESNDMVMNYLSTNEAKVVEGIAPGMYFVEIEGEDTIQQIEIQDTAQVQHFNLTVKHWQNTYLYLILGIAVIVCCGTGTVFAVLKHRKEKKIDA